MRIGTAIPVRSISPAAARTRSSSLSGNTIRHLRSAARWRMRSTNVTASGYGNRGTSPLWTRRSALELAGQCLGDRRMNETLEIAVMLGHFAHDARADVGRLHRRDHEDRLEALRHVAVHECHLKLVLEIAHGP